MNLLQGLLAGLIVSSFLVVVLLLMLIPASRRHIRGFLSWLGLVKKPDSSKPAANAISEYWAEVPRRSASQPAPLSIQTAPAIPYQDNASVRSWKRQRPPGMATDGEECRVLN